MQKNVIVPIKLKISLDIFDFLWYNKKKERGKMKNLVEKIESKVIRKYGFENRKTIFVFRVTEIIRKIEKF